MIVARCSDGNAKEVRSASASARGHSSYAACLSGLVSALLIVFTMFRSIAHTLRHDGIVWRGTRYELEELRKGMV